MAGCHPGGGRYWVVSYRAWGPGEETENVLINCENDNTLDWIANTWVDLHNISSDLHQGSDSALKKGARENFIGHPQMKQTTYASWFNYDKFQIGFLPPFYMLLNNLFNTVILVRKIECKVILRFTEGAHNTAKGNERRQQEWEGEKGKTSTLLIQISGPTYYSPHIPPSHKIYTSDRSETHFLEHALQLQLPDLHWLSSLSLSSGIWFPRKLFLNLPNPIIRHSDPMHTLLWHQYIKINFSPPLDCNIFDRMIYLLFMLYTQTPFLTQITQFLCNILSLILFSNF